MWKRHPRLLLLPLLALAVPTVRAADALPEAPRVGGRLAYADHERVELVGDMWADLPLVGVGPGHVFTAWTLRSAITGATSNLALTVEDVEYDGDVGFRLPVGGFARLSFFAGQRGRSAVDQPGAAWVRHAGVAIASRDHGRSATPEDALERVSWRLGAGAVLDDSGVRADAIVRGDARARILGERLAFDLELDALVDGGHWRADTTFGPSFGFAVADGRRMALFVRYIDADNPLGIRGDAWLAGYEYVEGPTGYRRSGAGSAGEIDGWLAFGAGEDDRESAELYLRFLTPELADDVRIAFALDANVLTGPVTHELYYLYDLGLERTLRVRSPDGEARAVIGGYFYHRSNHQLERSGTVTSTNVVEAGIETPNWQARHDPPRGRLGLLDARLRVGYLLNSDFGEDHRWHARGGLRWRLPLSGPVIPFVRAEAETGDVNRRTVAVGVFVNGFELQVERRTDDQYFGHPRQATLGTVGYVF